MFRSGRKTRPVLIRDLEAGDHLEVFLVSAVAAVLLIRTFLLLTGYPQVGGSNLHIAHMLWGGLLMLVALLILLSFLPLRTRKLAAFLGGLGFGTFVDEIGKFVTRDHDYFYEPAVPLIYASLVLIVVAGRALRFRREVNPWEYLLNAIRGLQEVALHDLDLEEQRRALSYLERSDPQHPLVPPLRELFNRAALVPSPAPGRLETMRRRLRTVYRRLAGKNGFRQGVVVFFTVEQILVFLVTAGLFFQPVRGMGELRALPGSVLGVEDLSVFDYGEIVSALCAGLLAVAGVAALRRSRIRGLILLERSALVSILLTQVFVFYRERVLALAGLAVHAMVWAVLRYAIEQERTRPEEPLRPEWTREEAGGGAGAAGGSGAASGTTSSNAAWTDQQ